MEYKKLVEIYQELENTSKRLHKTYIISRLLKDADRQSLPLVILLLQGKVFPAWDEHKIGVSSRYVLKAINVATGSSVSKVESDWRKTGDLGLTAEKLIGTKQQKTLFRSMLTVGKVVHNMRKLAELEGAGTVDRKIKLIAELLTSAGPEEAKYLVRTILEELRVGVGEGSLRDAVVWAFFWDKLGIRYLHDEMQLEMNNRSEYSRYVEAVQRAYDLTNDFGKVAETAKFKGIEGLKRIDIELFKPLKVMLALKVQDVEEGFERCGKPLDAEYKLDGFRIQVHKKGSKIELYTRRLEKITRQFPEVVDYVKKCVEGESLILDSEAAGYSPKTGSYLPFQSISQRIKRKYKIEEMSRKFPVELNVFDILYYAGKSLVEEPLTKRRKLIERLVKNEPRKIVVVKNLVSSKKAEIEAFYRESLQAGNEGIMLKKLDSPYRPGARVNHMVKLKPTMESLDLVIIGAEWGEGKRATWLSSFTLACIDEEGNFLEIGKMGTGIKEKAEQGISFIQLTEELKPLILSEKGREVKLKPKLVVEVDYEEIQKSPTYSSGFALRFPRLKSLRSDRTPSEISTLSMIEDIYYSQNK